MNRIALLFVCLSACPASPPSRADAYGAELMECNRKATTLRESIECENSVRARYGREPRDAGGDL